MIKLPILMTASVSTRGMAGADFSDEEREKMYLETVGFYERELLEKDKDRRIIFVENYGWDIDEFKVKTGNLPEGRIEFISLDPNDFDVSKGKGYNELILINQALEKSQTLRDAGAFMKVTGRYPVYNLADYLHEAEKFINAGGKFYGDIKDHKVYDFLFPHNTSKRNGYAAYTVLFATTVDFYKTQLGPLYAECNDYVGRWVECVWYDALKECRSKKGCGVSLRLRRGVCSRPPRCYSLSGAQPMEAVG